MNTRGIGQYFSGERKGKLVSAACDASTMMHNRIPSRALHAVFMQDAQLRGIAGVIRDQTKYDDVSGFCIYLAPMSDGEHNMIAERVFERIDNQLDTIGG
eukprot:308355-Pyramimonas_sp.AAC.1